MQADFYHLTTTPLDRALPNIVGRVMASGERLLIVSASEAQRAHVDRLLWTFAADSFVPHAQAGACDDTLQPVLIAAEAAAANGAKYLMIVDGDWRADAVLFDRVFHFFDEAAVAAARVAWKALAARDDVERRYWKQDEGGRWSQAA